MAEAKSRERTVHLKKLNELKTLLPWYVVEYIDVKKKNKMSPSTLSQYSRDFIRFLKWLIEQKITEATSIKDIPHQVLGNLRKDDVETYIESLEVDRELSEETINRNISSLKSLFKYLSTQTEDQDGECYFYRNVLAKVNLIRNTNDDSQKAALVAAKIFQGNTDKEFMRYLIEDYPLKLSKQGLSHYKRNCERDLAMISLFLGSGVRVSELVQLTLDDINFQNNTLKVLRKGNNKSVIKATKSSLDDVKQYLKVRKDRYRVPDSQKYVFVTNYRKECAPLSVRAVQHIVGKYTKSFAMKMSPHKFRHTFATKFYLVNKDQVSLMRQLGHNSIQTTTIYTNMDMTEMEKQMDALDEYEADDELDK
ncbi:site-specific recombinase XerD [Evansella vedderi]|uniref:Site-specific recombinase XerD n=1 Tax=Evansella vedderi TaxID=38282 RepID=A0ABT9ZWK3_9BACI|nr:tyrosine recombinase XerS [Evansella vedderi]MDQ0255603.1 site-specific recombinase XerD [Evansella vedderi]